MTSRPFATIVEESDGRGRSWWTLFVGSVDKPIMSASYPSQEAALADAPLWVPQGAAAKIVVAVVPLPAFAEAAE